MIQDMYEQEFFVGIKCMLGDYFSKTELQDADVWKIGPYAVNTTVLRRFLRKSCGWGNYYADCRRNGMLMEDIFGVLAKHLNTYKVPIDYKKGEIVLIDIERHLWYDTLSVYQGGILVYITYPEQIEVVKAFVVQMNAPVILLSEFEIPAETDLPDSVIAITLEFSEEYRFTNIFLECNFPLIFHYFNLFDILIQTLRPQKMMIPECGNFQEEILRIVGKAYDISCIKNRFSFYQ